MLNTYTENSCRLSKEIPLRNILFDISKTANTPFDQAPLLPPGAFHSEELLELEMDRLFGDEWICIARVDDFEKPGSFITVDLGGVSILSILQQDGSVRSFINACAHRRAQLVTQAEGHRSRFTCPYHAWTFALDGGLVKAPYMDKYSRVDEKNEHLTSIATEVWLGFVFAKLNTDNDVPSVADRLATFTENVIGQYKLDRYETVLKEEITAKGNWKNLIENFMESYHVFAAHKGTFATAGKLPEDYKCGDQYDWVAYHLGTKPSEDGTGAAHPNDPTLQGIWRRRSVVFCVFPSLLVYAAPDLLWYMSVQPRGVDQFHAKWAAAVPREILEQTSGPERAELVSKVAHFMDVANAEDLPLVEALFVGTTSSLAPNGHFHSIERNVWDFARYLARVLCED